MALSSPSPPSSDRKRPFEEAAKGCVPLNAPSLSSPPCKKAARQPAEKSDAIVDLLDDEGGSDDEVEFVGEAKPQKKVRFHEIEHEVKYFKRYPVEGPSPSLSAIDEEETSAHSSSVHPSSEHSRATADFTILSSNHGRARRQLRRISKHDLRAAIKHGVKTPAHPGRVGERRWKFVHNGLVYITDETCRHEITSYREEVRIDPYPVSLQMEERHVETKRILKEEPYLATGHTYIIMDQSGSMRDSDVDGFVSRSHAAYGTLALEFIAEQLNQRGPNQDDLFAESVTLVEMRDEGRAVFDQPQPLDWILFNRLLQRPNIARPSSHGNYNESIQLVAKMMMREYNALLKDGADPEDLPFFSLVFLSDGRPSDFRTLESERRTEILKTLVGPVKERFSFYAMGIGARDTEFGALQSMVNTVAENGGTAQFVHAGVSTVKLSETFSNISSTLTSHRTTLLGDEDANRSEKVKKDFTMRRTGNVVGLKMPSQFFVNGDQHSITRYRFNKGLLRRNADPWIDAKLANHGANGIEVETEPFGRGAERLAYRFHEIKKDGAGCKRVGKTMVAKDSLHLNENETKESFHQDFCHIQRTAYDLAESFNSAVRLAPPLRSATEETKPPTLRFMLPHVYTIKDKGTDEEKGYLVEKMLPGKFLKFNSNNGYVRGAKDGVHSTRTMELVSGKVHLEEFVQAFSHWVYEHTDHKMIVVDLQGVLNEEGRYPEFQLTDPAICTRLGERFGKTDMRLRGIRRFCTTHRCGTVCKGLGLKCITTTPGAEPDNRTAGFHFGGRAGKGGGGGSGRNGSGGRAHQPGAARANGNLGWCIDRSGYKS
ncbi:hypothetical protein ACHAXT_009942 [Thalassiosira profunda]